MNEAEAHIIKARASLEFARYALAGNYTEEAGRSAYLAAYHAAAAFIHQRKGKAPKYRKPSSLLRIFQSFRTADG